MAVAALRFGRVEPPLGWSAPRRVRQLPPGLRNMAKLLEKGRPGEIHRVRSIVRFAVGACDGGRPPARLERYFFGAREVAADVPPQRWPGHTPTKRSTTSVVRGGCDSSIDGRAASSPSTLTSSRSPGIERACT